MRVARYLLSFGGRTDFGLMGWEILGLAFPLAVAAPLLRSVGRSVRLSFPSSLFRDFKILVLGLVNFVLVN